MNDLTLLIAPHGLSLFRLDQDGWRSCRLTGDDIRPLSEPADDVLTMLKRELHSTETRATYRLHLVYADARPCREWLLGMIGPAFAAGFAHVQALALEPLLAHLPQWDPDAAQPQPDHRWCLDYLLPALQEQLLDPVRRHIMPEHASAALEHEAVDLREQNAALDQRLHQAHLAATRQRQEYLVQLQALQEQITMLGTPPMAELVYFMPLFYRHFWEALRTDEVAQLLRTHDIPVITSPFREPDGGALAVMRKKYLALAEPTRHSVLAFVRDLQAYLTVRAESLQLMEQA